MKLPLTAFIALSIISTGGYARTYIPIPAAEPQVLISASEGLYRHTPAVLNLGFEAVAEQKASFIWHRYNQSLYGVVDRIVSGQYSDEASAMVDDYRYERERARGQHQQRWRQEIEQPIKWKIYPF